LQVAQKQPAGAGGLYLFRLYCVPRRGGAGL